MSINHQVMREGMTVLPETVDQATGEKIEGTAQIVDTRFANLVEEETETESYVEVDDDALDPEDRDPTFEIRLSDTEEDIRTGEYTVSDEFANEVAGANIGDSPADITVKFLATKVFQGHMTPEEAFADAVGSGLNPDDLMRSYWSLKEYFEN